MLKGIDVAAILHVDQFSSNFAQCSEVRLARSWMRTLRLNILEQATIARGSLDKNGH